MDNNNNNAQKQNCFIIKPSFCDKKFLFMYKYNVQSNIIGKYNSEILISHKKDNG